jgi:uncharacterized repeat protein (TIGR01451 family)
MDCPATTRIEFEGQQGTNIFDVTLVGPTNNGLTWTYQVEKEGRHDLSHFNIQICPDIDPDEIVWEIRALVNGVCANGNPLDSGTGPDGDHFLFQAAGSGNNDDCIKPANVPYIKFDNLDDFETEDFCFTFTLPECLQVECICVNANSSSNSGCACIQGPSSTCEECDPDQPMLTIDKECPTGTFRAGDTVTINIPVANTGAATAEDVVVTDVINVPAGITIDNLTTTPLSNSIVPPTGPYTNQNITITWNLGDLAEDDDTLLTVTFDITEVTAAGVITNAEAEVSATNADRVVANPCTVSVVMDVPPSRGIKF